MTLKRKVWMCSGIAVTAVALMGSRFRPVVIWGESMRPAFKSGQVALMDKRSSDLSHLKRGDIIVFHHGREIFIKRVFALQGETIRMLNFSNGATGMIGDDAFPADRILRLARTHPGQVHISPLRIPQGKVFVVGDNRTYSVDSREFGPIPVTAIVGKVV